MTIRHVPAAVLAAALLAGTSGLALAQSSTHPSSSGAPAAQNSSSQTEHESHSKAPRATTGQSSMEKGSPSGQSTQAAPEGKNSSAQPSPKETNQTRGQNREGTATETSPSKQNAQGTSREPSHRNAEGASQPSGRNAQGTSQPSGRNAQTGSQPSGERSTTATAPANERVNLNSQQKTEVKTKIIDNKSAPHVSHVNFNVSVGVTVPTTVHWAPVPEFLVEIHPAWKEYVYFVYEDEVVIVNPHTRKIVEVIVVS